MRLSSRLTVNLDRVLRGHPGVHTPRLDLHLVVMVHVPSPSRRRCICLPFGAPCFASLRALIHSCEPTDPTTKGKKRDRLPLTCEFHNILPRATAQSRLTLLRADFATDNQRAPEKSALRGQIRGRKKVRGTAMVGGMFEGIGELEQSRLAICSTEK